MCILVCLFKPDMLGVRKVSGSQRIPDYRSAISVNSSRDLSPENRPVYNGFRFKSVRFNQSHLYTGHIEPDEHRTQLSQCICTATRVFALADVWVRSPQKLFYFMIETV